MPRSSGLSSGRCGNGLAAPLEMMLASSVHTSSNAVTSAAALRA